MFNHMAIWDFWTPSPPETALNLRWCPAWHERHSACGVTNTQRHATRFQGGLRGLRAGAMMSLLACAPSCREDYGDHKPGLTIQQQQVQFCFCLQPLLAQLSPTTAHQSEITQTGPLASFLPLASSLQYAYLCHGFSRGCWFQLHCPLTRFWF